jgi:hypothetical protein
MTSKWGSPRADPRLRKGRQLERQGGNLTPVGNAGQCGVRENGRGFQAVGGSCSPQTRDPPARTDVLIGAIDQPAIACGDACELQRGPYRQRGSQTRWARRAFSPAAILILMMRQPVQAVDQKLAKLSVKDDVSYKDVRSPVPCRQAMAGLLMCEDQGAHGGRGGQRRT